MFEVLSTSGDTHLGGDDFDRRIVDFLADDFQKNEGVDLRQDRQALQRLTEAAEKAKVQTLHSPYLRVRTLVFESPRNSQLYVFPASKGVSSFAHFQRSS